MKLTPWFPPDVKPVRVGVYKTRFDDWAAYSYWDGKKWRNQRGGKFEASISSFAGAEQDKEWCGLAEEPQP